MTIQPIAKPRREDRHKHRIDYTQSAIPKSVPVRDPDYRRYVRDIGECALLNFEGACESYPDRAPIECAHLPFSGERGVGRKATDAASVPLCNRHHAALDDHTLPWQIVAALWSRALFIREGWWRMRSKGEAQ